VEVPLEPLLQRVHASFVDDAGAKGLKLLRAPTRAWVHTDPQMLERIVRNLVGNAVRYTRHGGVVLGCRRAAGSVRIEVWDSGVGIPQEAQRQVFAEFYQVAGPRSLGGEGLGLGLAIVERLSTLLAHPVDLRSHVGVGSRFAITVPRVEPRAPSTAVVPSEPHGDLLRGRHVLVVDDDELVLQSTTGLLQSWGCTVVAAASGREALDRLGSTPLELIISDVHLAGGEGAADVIDRVRTALAADLPALLVSGDVTPATRERARALGLTLLDKPVRPMALRALASRLLAAHAPPAAAGGPKVDPASSRAA
jgi:CheY-like chemotaxis protein